ncbi:zinc ribbon domain-containing protein [Halorubrum vacuolatum]|uniref:Double zinc ribbon n=1 Tax=Halorubrum vacuolatum TaxID=63740 RepID=A0A238W0I1_HALVU|nr:zinc ribbon domain-containing protein [Halorubrum vacuolatum]SNR40105.1 Double zinc ribbon [Halorubrum vacuolatum]
MPSETNAPGAGAERCHDCGGTIPSDARFCPSCGVVRGGKRPPAYCANCGTGFGPDDAYCSRCGEPRSATDGEPATAEKTRGRSGSSDVAADHDTDREYDAFRRRVARYVEAGWEVRRDHGDRVELVDRDVGSIPIHVLLLLFTGGVGNLLYGWYHYSILAETRYLSMHDPDPSSPERIEPATASTTESTAVETVSTYLLSGLLLLVGALLLGFSLGGATAINVGTALAVGLGLGFFLVGLGIAPPVEARLKRRHGPRAFGRHRTVDHRVIRPVEQVEEPCVVCGESFRGGLLRRRRDETVIAGVPIRTHSMRHNHYCAECAQTELFDDDDTVEFEGVEVDELGRNTDTEDDDGNVATEDDDGNVATEDEGKMEKEGNGAFEWSTSKSKSEHSGRE